MSETRMRHPGLVIYSPFYYPKLISTGKSNTLLGKKLYRESWDIDVVCSHPLYPHWQPIPTNGQLPGTRFFRGGGLLHYPASAMLRRALLELWFTFHAVRTTIKIKNEIDVAVSIYLPSLFAIFMHAILPERVRKVGIIHDLQGVYSQQGYSSGSSLLTKIIHAVEERCFKSSDRLIFSSQDIARVAIESLGIQKSKSFVQYPFITLDPGLPLTDALESILPWGTRHVVYPGALGEKQDPELMSELMAKAAVAFPEARFHIFSGGPKFDALREQYERKGLLYFHALIPEEQLAELYARSSVQVVPQAPGTEHGSLPSKLPNLLAAGVQILAICSDASEVSVLLKKTEMATLVPDWTEDSFLAGMTEALHATATITHETRRASSAHLFPLFQVSQLAHLVID